MLPWVSCIATTSYFAKSCLYCFSFARALAALEWMEAKRALAFQNASAKGAASKFGTRAAGSSHEELDEEEVLDEVELVVEDLGDEFVLEEVLEEEEEEEWEVEGDLGEELLVEVRGAMPLAALVLPLCRTFLLGHSISSSAARRQASMIVSTWGGSKPYNLKPSKSGSTPVLSLMSSLVK